MLACTGCDSAKPAETTLTDQSTPYTDRGELCFDVGDLRACYAEDHEECREGVCLVERRVPPQEARSGLGFRCVGMGEKRRCVDRAEAVASFVCEGERCVQPHPRLPDANEWECQETGGASLCHKKANAAGVVASAIEPGFICGRRAGESRASLCVDFSPDFPDGSPRGWKCHYEYVPRRVRACQKDEGAHSLTDHCDPARPCLDGSLCVAGRCLPRRPKLSCVGNADCKNGACRFGSCREGS